MARRFDPPVYQYNADTQRWQMEDANGNLVGSYTLEEVTSNQLLQYGNSVRISGQGSIAFNIAPSRQSRFMDFGNGVYQFFNEIPARSVNSAQYVSAYTEGRVDITVPSPSGSEYAFTLERFGITPTGAALYYKEGEAWRDAWRTALHGSAGEADRQALIAAGYELATYDKAVERGIVSTLAARYHEQVEALINAGLINDQGNFILDFSEAAKFLASASMNTLTTYAVRVLSVGGASA